MITETLSLPFPDVICDSGPDEDLKLILDNPTSYLFATFSKNQAALTTTHPDGVFGSSITTYGSTERCEDNAVTSSPRGPHSN